MNKPLQLFVALSLCAMLGSDQIAHAGELKYGCSEPPLEVTYAIVGDHYNGMVNCGNLFLQPDIPTAPVVRWKEADPTKLYTLMMLDFDGNATGSWATYPALCFAPQATLNRRAIRKTKL